MSEESTRQFTEILKQVFFGLGIITCIIVINATLNPKDLQQIKQNEPIVETHIVEKEVVEKKVISFDILINGINFNGLVWLIIPFGLVFAGALYAYKETYGKKDNKKQRMRVK